jgi:site-specific recombinase XerD
MRPDLFAPREGPAAESVSMREGSLHISLQGNGGNPHRDRVPAAQSSEHASIAGVSLADAIEGFLLSRRVGNCSGRTVALYAANLGRFADAAGDELAACAPLLVQRYLTALRERMRAVTVHQHFRGLRTFFTWCVAAGLLADHPMRGLAMRAPKTLPRVPEDADVRRLLAACSETFEGRRNRALVALLADSGLRISEALRLRVEDLTLTGGTLIVRGGKGAKDGPGFFGGTTAALLRTWLAVRRPASPEDLAFCDRHGRPLSRYAGLRVLHRLSVRAGLARKVGPHALRHYAATSLLRRTGDLELVRRVLRHESLAMTLRYAHLTGLEVAAKFRRASPLDALCGERR